jgi:DNA-binding MarR family transcriptional regulator
MPPSRTDPPAPRLGDFLCFSVYSANLAFGRAYKPLLDGLGLTYLQFVALVALWEEDDQTVGGLGAKLFLESNTLTPVIKKLEALGYLTRRRDPADERQVRVRLTDAGRALRDRAGAVTLAGRIGLAPDEAAKLQQAVSALRDSLLRQP